MSVIEKSFLDLRELIDYIEHGHKTLYKDKFFYIDVEGSVVFGSNYCALFLIRDNLKVLSSNSFSFNLSLQENYFENIKTNIDESLNNLLKLLNSNGYCVDEKNKKKLLFSKFPDFYVLSTVSNYVNFRDEDNIQDIIDFFYKENALMKIVLNSYNIRLKLCGQWFENIKNFYNFTEEEINKKRIYITVSVDLFFRIKCVSIF
jgi:hypothetical protein